MTIKVGFGYISRLDSDIYQFDSDIYLGWILMVIKVGLGYLSRSDPDTYQSRILIPVDISKSRIKNRLLVSCAPIFELPSYVSTVGIRVKKLGSYTGLDPNPDPLSKY